MMIPSTLRLLDSEPEATSPVVAGVDWKLEAACRGQLELFFARKAERPEARARRETKAKRVCDVCPVFDECRSIARANCEYGYWAGESEEDRHVLGFRVSAPIGLRARLADLEKRQNKSA
ncbi:MAG: WhiB family redox-sensing transcriptional regulator [Ilumatobacter sp.]|jgi:WhiB family redox-sensing transcriptional regulator